MLSEGDFFFDDNFVRHNLSFLLEEEFSDMKNISLSHGNESSIYKDVTAKLECSINTSWSSSSSGSITSVKEEKTKYVNVCLSSKEKPNSLSLDSRFSFDFDICEARCDKCFTVDFQSNFATSTPVKNRDIAEQNERTEQEKISRVRRDISASEDYCNFCRKNGESEYVYSSHRTKLLDGTVSCPILKKYVCELCGSTGENAHTRKYCPLYKKKIQPKATTRRLSNGVVVSCFNHKTHEELKEVVRYMAAAAKDFITLDIRMMLQRLQKCINCNRDYVEE